MVFCVVLLFCKCGASDCVHTCLYNNRPPFIADSVCVCDQIYLTLSVSLAVFVATIATKTPTDTHRVNYTSLQPSVSLTRTLYCL